MNEECENGDHPHAAAAAAVDDGDSDERRVCYTTSNNNNTTTCSIGDRATRAASQIKNGSTLKGENGKVVFVDDDEDGVITTHASATADDEDYVGTASEEEDGAYKTRRLATFPQSEHDIIQQQQDQGINALISTIRLFLEETWNWFYYFLVTIIFLNLVHFADRRSGDSVVGEDLPSVEVDGLAKEGDPTKSDSEQSATGNVVDQENSSGESKTSSEVDQEISDSEEAELLKMSPNTCSIQNQQETVEEVQEAIVTVDEKSATSMAPQANEEIVSVETETETIQQHQMQPEITVVLAGDNVDDEEESDEITGEDDMDAIRRDSVDSYTSSDGNLGDTEDGSEGKAGSIKSGSDEPIDKVEVAQKIISQVESMFSDEHLAKDGFLLKHVRRRSDGFVSLKLVAGLRKVKQISREFPVVLNALRDSSKLEINAEGTKVRRAEPLTPFLKSVAIKSKDKDGKQTKEKDTASSNDENQLPTATIRNISSNNKSASKAGNKDENDNGANNKRGQNRRNSAQNNANNGNQSRRNSNANNNNNHAHLQNRKSSNTSTTSSNGSRHGSFSKPSSSSPIHPADLLRNVYTMTAYSSGEECQSPQSGRRRGGSLPIAAINNRSAQNGGAYLSPNSSPPNNGSGGGPFYTIGPNGGARPKSNSYCEGAGPSTMSPWLQRRKASASSRLSQGELVISGVVRQPRGPDGTKGFASGYRAMILQERLQQQNNSAVSA